MLGLLAFFFLYAGVALYSGIGLLVGYRYPPDQELQHKAGLCCVAVGLLFLLFAGCDYAVGLR
jgi:hypothetical protein